MSGSILPLFTTYLIYPLVGLLMIVVAALIAKKNGLLKNKRMITYTIISVLLLAVPALLGFLDYNFMPYGYVALAALYLLVGYYNDRVLEWVFKKEVKYRVRITYMVFQLILGMLLFTLVFNLCNELKYGLWASTMMLPFVLFSLLYRTYDVFIHIPALIYKVWDYSACQGYPRPDDLDHSNLDTRDVELFKKESDTEPVHLNARVPEGFLFGDWIKLVFEDYNRKNPHAPIDVYSQEGGGWIFYVKSWFLTPRRYLDYDLTVAQNRIKKRHLIVAKRVRNTIID